jgi:hypothetical protein
LIKFPRKSAQKIAISPDKVKESGRCFVHLFSLPFSMTRMALILGLGLVFLSWGCSSSSGKRIPGGKFAQLYADLIVVGQKSYTQGWDRIRSQAEADSLLARAGVTRADYQATLEWLNEDIERWKETSESVSKIIDSTATPRPGAPSSR